VAGAPSAELAKAAVEILNAWHDLAYIEILLNVSARMAADLRSPLVVNSQRSNGIGERARIPGRNEHAVKLRLDDLWRSAAIGGDHWDAGGHRLEQHDPEWFFPRGNNQQIDGFKEIRWRHESHQINV